MSWLLPQITTSFLLCQVLNLSGSVLNSVKGNRPIALDVKLLILKGLTLVAGSIKF